MKKALALLMLAVMVLCMFSGCSKFDPEEELKVKVNSDVSLYCMVNYANVKGVFADVTYINASGNTYELKGKVTVNDQYNEKYVGKFTGTYILNGKEFTKQSLDITTPTKE